MTLVHILEVWPKPALLDVPPWIVHHDALCPVEDDPDLGRFWRCDVGHYVHHDQMDSLEPEIDGLAPGRYLIEAWSGHQPSAPNGPEEWDGGIHVVGPMSDFPAHQMTFACHEFQAALVRAVSPILAKVASAWRR